MEKTEVQGKRGVTMFVLSMEYKHSPGENVVDCSEDLLSTLVVGDLRGANLSSPRRPSVPG